jgi:molecular chaperone DnaK
LSEGEIQKMVKDAEVNAAEDHRRVELVNARNQGEATVHSVRKSLAEHGDKLGDEDKGRIDDAIRALEEALKGEDKAEIDKRSAELATASQKLGEMMYAKMQAEQGDAAGAAGAAGAGAAGAGAGAEARRKDEDVVDADFKEVRRG